MNENLQARIDLRQLLIRFITILGLIVGIAACGSPTPALIPSDAPATPTEELSSVYGCEAEKVPVTNVHWFRDADGAWRVVGVIVNNSSRAVGKLVTGVETKDKNNQPADQGEDVVADTLNLQPGDKAPFIAWIGREIPNLDHFEIEVDECVLAEPAERSKVDIRGGRMTVDDNGRAQVTAELFNPGSKTVLVNGLMAGVYDQAGGLLAADNAIVSARYLAPGESGPARATIDLPPGGKDQIKSYQFFMDVLVDEPAPLPVDIKRDVRGISHYIDKNGHFHLVGQLTNPSQKGLVAFLQGTVYTDANKSAVADVAAFDTWVPLGPGETRPFDLADWGALNNIHTLWDDIQTQNPAIELRFEPLSTWASDVKPVKLTVEGDNVSFENGQAVFTGKVHADANISLANGLVVAVVRKKSGGEIVATSSVHLDIAASATPGQVFDYRVVVPLPTDADPATLENEVTAVGQ
jgi:hypothetical protein